ncbi:5' nucleotidase, NT5C type [Salicibibacter cibarius]|uniref:5' nucleotidase, NT5C type n=1 Tax=Salicibibacter cibarius TaxID=2743000 RepID=UPI001FE58FD1|nr:5'-3'-deoxyribonucleotidase [Salicibibacter cibarius]
MIGKNLEELRPHYKDRIQQYLNEPSFFSDLSIIKGSQEVIRDLQIEYEIFITTAAMEHPTSFEPKYQWLKKNFEFLSDLNFVFCGDKSIINADYLIDDNARHFKKFRGQGILFTAPHNIKETSYVRVNDWSEVREYFLG